MDDGPVWASTPVEPTVEQHAEALFKPFSSLDEPVRETILRDVRAVGQKLKVVLSPLDRNPASLAYASVAQTEDTQQQELSENDAKVLQELKDWDLWGPLVLCLTLGVALSLRAPADQSSIVFAAVFCAVWVGGTVVTINAQLLGGTISFFQSLCVLGYSIFPLTLAALAIGVIKLFFNWVWLDIILVGCGLVWAVRAGSVFLSIYVKPERRFLALYPVFFFYTFLGWMIILF